MLEAICAGRSPASYVKSLRQPGWALPMVAWYLVGIVYYVACFAAIYRVTRSESRTLALALIAIVMTSNAAWNLIFFRRRNLKAAVLFYLPYSALVILLICVLWRADAVAAGLFIAYAAYLLYALAWSYRVWKLN